MHVTEDAVAYTTGNGVCFLSLEHRTLPFLHPQLDDFNSVSLGGISALASCAALNQIAVAPRSLTPKVVVLEYPTLNQLYVLSGGAVLDFEDIAFAQNGLRIAAISKLPDFQVTVWDTATQQILCFSLLPEPCTHISFNPLCNTQICTSGPSGLFMWTVRDSTQLGKYFIHQKLIVRELEDQDDDDDLAAHMEMNNYEEAQGSRNDFVCHCWNVNGSVYAATRAGDICTVAAVTAQLLGSFPAIYAPSGSVVNSDDAGAHRLVTRDMFLTKSHLVAVHSDGKLRWIATSSFEVQRVVDLSGAPDQDDGDSNGGSTRECLPWVVPVSACISPAYSTIVVGTADGRILSVPSATGEIGDADDFDIDAFADASDDARVQLCAELHADSVYAVCAVFSASPNEKSAALLTAAADGSVRLWNSSLNRMLRSTVYGQPFVCADSSPRASIVALGCVDGVMHICACDDCSLISLFCDKLFKAAVTCTAFHPVLSLLAVASMADGRIFVIDVSCSANTGCGPIATINCEKPYSLAWADTETDAMLFVGTADGIFWSTGVPSPGSKEANSMLKDQDKLRTSPLQLSRRGKLASGPPMVFVCDGLSGTSSTKQQTILVANGTSRLLQEFCLIHEPGGCMDTLEPVARYSAHAQPILCMAKCRRQDGCLLATGGKDGQVVLWASGNDGSSGMFSVRSLRSYAGGHSTGVVRVCIGDNACFLVSASMDGTVNVWDIDVVDQGSAGGRVSTASLPLAPGDTKFAGSFDSVQPRDTSTLEVALMDRIEQDMQDRVAKQDENAKYERLSQFHELRKELEGLHSHNANVEPLEKLESAEFIINLNEKSRLETEGSDRAAIVQARIARENLTRELIWDRLMGELWHSMEHKGREIYSIRTQGSSNMRVSDFAVPQVDQQRLILYDHVMLQRRIELREIRESQGMHGSVPGTGIGTPCWLGSTEELKSGPQIQWLVNAGKLAPSSRLWMEARTAVSGSAKNTNESQNEVGRVGAAPNAGFDAEDAPASRLREESIFDLLYHPLALKTSAQKKVQILLLEQLIRQMKLEFNKKFDDVFATKEEKVDEITTKNARIAEILVELKVEEDVFKPRWHENEFPEKNIIVSDSEVPVSRYISEAERNELAKAEAERKRLAAINTIDNAPERALMEMMGGTLEIQTDLNTLDRELVREEWMVSRFTPVLHQLI